MSNFDEFKEILNDLLIEHNLNRLQLAKQIGISFATINDYFNQLKCVISLIVLLIIYLDLQQTKISNMIIHLKISTKILLRN